MSFSVIIPSKTASNLIPCVEAVWKHEPWKMRTKGRLDRPNIFVVNDGVDDPYITEPPLLYCDWVNGITPFIFSRNCNIGIRAVSNHDVILLNDDALLETPGGFSVLAKAAEEHPEFGVISATTNCVGNPRQYPKGVGLREERESVAFICVYIPRRTIDTVGLLDERFTAYGWEDNDYCHRVKLAGLKLGIHDGCFVDHKSLRSTFRGSAIAAGNIEPGRKIFREKWAGIRT